MMNRRRFITVSAAALVAAPANASPMRWTGQAMGADVSLVLEGGTKADLAAAIAEIRAAEARFSIYDRNSELSRINALGESSLSPAMSELLLLCDEVHRTTEGLFDPTIQPVFRALFEGKTPPWHLVGWDRLSLGPNGIQLANGQALTLNGIAQGFATDRVRQLLEARGYTRALVSVGEQAAIGGPFRLALEDPTHGRVATRSLTNRAIATSSPGALMLGGQTHVFDPRGMEQTLWSTVSVEAENAALADGLSTALCLAPRDQVARIIRTTGTRATLVDTLGDVVTLG